MQSSSPLVFFTPAEPGFWVVLAVAVPLLIRLFYRYIAVSVRPLAWAPVSLLLPYLAFMDVDDRCHVARSYIRCH